MSDKPGILLDNRLFRHAIARKSQENPERLRNIYKRLDTSEYRRRFQRIPARPANSEAVEAVHSRFYLDQIREHGRLAEPFSFDRDTYIMAETLECAYLAAGGCLQMAEAIMSGAIDRGFALVRPPGHHAEPGRAMGFCVLNNAAITAAWLRIKYGLSRILIFDFDIHHGNGTQEAFYGTNEVLVLSIHQNDLFPFTGAMADLGEGPGTGYSINIPVFPQYGDSEYTYIAGRLLQAVVEQYLPQFIIVSAGFDGHTDDPISRTRLTTRWYATVTRLLRRLAVESCQGRLMMVLEGGYNPTALEASVMAVLEALLEPDPSMVGIMPSTRAARLIEGHPAKQFWTF
jgi:acetoin utilization deacetylase AcuC-like enzyme